MTTRRKGPHRRRLLWWTAGGLAALLTAAVLVFLLSSPEVDLLLEVAPKEIPAGWVSTEEPAAEEVTADPTAVAPGPAIPYASSGRLALLGNGKPFGEEVYELRIDESGATLVSSGRFWFKVILATVHVTFEQTLEAESDLRPVMYVAQFHAPFGLDRSIRASVLDDRMTVERSGGTEEFQIDPARAFPLGTFSTYVLLPRLFALRHEDGLVSLDVLVFGGPPSQASRPAGERLPTMTLERTGTARLRAGSVLLDVDGYVVLSDLGRSELYARGDEFLALRAGTEDESLWVYRSDFFPNGLEVADDAVGP